MVGMGTLGALGGLLGRWRSRIGTRSLVIIGLSWGFVYGLITSFFWVLMISSIFNWASFTTYLVAGLPFFILQGVGNALLLMFLGRRTLRVFERFRLKLMIEIRDRIGESDVTGI
jgi:hypothetical protein